MTNLIRVALMAMSPKLASVGLFTWLATIYTSWDVEFKSFYTVTPDVTLSKGIEVRVHITLWDGIRPHCNECMGIYSNYVNDLVSANS